MNPIEEKAFDSLHQDVLPRLVQLMDEALAYRSKESETLPEQFFPIIQETLTLLKLLSQENTATENTATTEDSKEKTQGDMSDDEALALLASMDDVTPITATPSIPETQKEPEHGENDSDEDLALANEVVEEIPEFSNNEFGSDPDMLKDFITNVNELMEVLDEQVLALEHSEQSPGVIEEIFRAAHTLKGAAGMFGFKAIERIMHRMENYFDQVRKKKRHASSDGIDVILSALDMIKKLINAVKDGKPSGEKTAPIVEGLNRLCAGKTQKATVAVQAKEEIPDDTGERQKNSKKVEQSSIRVDLKRLDALVNLVGELVIDRTRFSSIEEELRIKLSHGGVTSNMSETVQLFGRHMNEIQDIIMKVRMVPIGNSFNKFPRVVRDLAKALQKEIDLVIVGEHTELDKTLVEQIGDPLVHLIRNAVDHGIEQPEERVAKGKTRKGTVSLSARQEGNQIFITIEDDGKGMDKEAIRKKGIEKGLINKDDNVSDRDIFNLIFEAGFSTAKVVTNISGRGVGMDVVKKQISKLKGSIDISSEPNKGSRISIQLPLTLAIVKSLLIQTRKEVFAIPLSAVVESIRIKPEEIQKVGDAEVIKRRNHVLPLLYLHEALDIDAKKQNSWYMSGIQKDEAGELRKKDPHKERLFVVVVGNGERRFGIVVDTLLNQQEMVIKSMGPLMRDIPCVAGGAILGNGEVVLVLDIGELEDLFRNKTRNTVAA
jgi:two-component system chemotaxis sensor kinase CheA